MKEDNILFFLPRYSVIPIISMLSLNLITYFFTPVITKHLHHYDFSLPIDSMIPLVPVFILPYFLAYVQWIVGYVMLARVSKEHCYTVMVAEMFAKLMICICFIVIPTTMYRPDCVGTDIFSRMVAFLYRMDGPINIFPSIHCLESYFCFRFIINQKTVGPVYKTVMGISTVLIFLSTVFLRQHVVVDAVGAIVVAEVGYIISKKIWAYVNTHKAVFN